MHPSSDTYPFLTQNDFPMKKLLLLYMTLCISQIVSAQFTIDGIIKDDMGEPLIGATIYALDLEGVGTSTDFDGTFRLEVPHLPITLIATYIGYEDQVINLKSTTYLEIILSEGELIECFITCCGPSRSMLVGPSHDVLNNSTGISARVQLPYLLGVSPNLLIDGNWNFTNDNNNLYLRVERYGMPRIGSVSTAIVGKYRYIDNPNSFELNQKIIGAQFSYRGFELMMGYVNQKDYTHSSKPLGPKNFNNDSGIDKADGLHIELSKNILRVFIQTELTHIKGVSQYEARIEYDIPGTRVDVRASWGSINGYQSAIFGVRRRFGL